MPTLNARRVIAERYAGLSRRFSPRAAREVQRALWFAALAWLLLYIGMLSVETPRIESQLTDAARHALADHGLPRARIVFTGRDAELSGEVSGRAAQQFARDLLHDLPGVRRVHDATQIVPARLPHLALQRRGGALSLSGELPTPDVAQHWRAQIQAALSHATFTDAISVNAEVADPLWRDGLTRLLPHLDRLQHLRVAAGERVSVAGLAASNDQYAQVLAAVRESFTGSRVKFRNQIGVRP